MLTEFLELNKGGLKLPSSDRTVRSEILLSDSLSLFAKRMNLPKQDYREKVCLALLEGIGEVSYSHVTVGEVRDNTVTVVVDSQSCYQSIMLRKAYFERELAEALNCKEFKLVLEHNKMRT